MKVHVGGWYESVEISRRFYNTQASKVCSDLMVQYELSCYEIGGNEPIDLIDPRQILDADAILLVFSLGSPDAIQQLRFYQARLAQIAPEVPLFLVGTEPATGKPEGEQPLIDEIENMAQNWGSRGLLTTSINVGLNAQGLLTNLIALPRSAGKTHLKLVFAGPARGGKTALITRLENGPLTGEYTPTSSTRITTVELDAPAPAPLGEDRSKTPVFAGDLSQLEGAEEKVTATNADGSKGIATVEAEQEASPSTADKPIGSNFFRDETTKDQSRLKTPEQSSEIPVQPNVPEIPSGPSDAQARPAAPPLPHAPIPAASAPSAKLRGNVAQILQQKGKSEAPLTKNVHVDENAPSTPSMPKSEEDKPSRLMAEMPEISDKTAPEIDKSQSEAFSREQVKSLDAAAGSGAFIEGGQKKTPPPLAPITTPATPLVQPSANQPNYSLTAPSSEEVGKTQSQDDDRRSDKAKRKEFAKAEKRSKREAETREAEIMDKTVPAPPETVTVERVLERKTTVFYRRQMNPLTRNKLSVVLSTLKIYEQLRLQNIIPADRVGGQETLKIKEISPFVHVQPIFPGCISVPAEMPLDARKDSDTADFHITPLATGPIMDACVRIYYEGKLVDTIQTPTKVVTQTSAKVSALAAVFLPIFGPLFDTRILEFFPSLTPFWNMVGGLESFFLYVAGAIGFFGAIMYYIHRPKQAIPIEANFPELQKFLEEDVKQPGLGEILKDKERSNEEI